MVITSSEPCGPGCLPLRKHFSLLASLSCAFPPPQSRFPCFASSSCDVSGKCGRLLDPLGHHREACAEAGVLSRRAFALESAAVRACHEAGARVTTKVDIVPQDRVDGRRLEVVADGLPLL